MAKSVPKYYTSNVEYRGSALILSLCDEEKLEWRVKLVYRVKPFHMNRL